MTDRVPSTIDSTLKDFMKSTCSLLHHYQDLATPQIHCCFCHEIVILNCCVVVLEEVDQDFDWFVLPVNYFRLTLFSLPLFLSGCLTKFAFVFESQLVLVELIKVAAETC